MYRASEKKESEELIVRRIARRLDRYLSEMERSLSRQPLTVEEKTEIVSLAAVPNLVSQETPSNKATNQAKIVADAQPPLGSMTDEGEVLSIDSQFGGLALDLGILEQSFTPTEKPERAKPLGSIEKIRPAFSEIEVTEIDAPPPGAPPISPMKQETTQKAAPPPPPPAPPAPPPAPPVAKAAPPPPPPAPPAPPAAPPAPPAPPVAKAAPPPPPPAPPAPPAAPPAPPALPVAKAAPPPPPAAPSVPPAAPPAPPAPPVAKAAPPPPPPAPSVPPAAPPAPPAPAVAKAAPPPPPAAPSVPPAAPAVEKTSPSEAQKKSLDNEKESQEAPPKSAANSLHHFDSPPASGAPKELEVLLHGKPNQFLVKGIRKDFLVTILVLVAIFFVVYFFVGPAYTH